MDVFQSHGNVALGGGVAEGEALGISRVFPD